MYSTFTEYSDLRNFAIYDGQNLDNFFQTLGDDSTTVLPNARSIKSSSKYFTIYASERIDSSNNGNTVLFTAEDSNKNCENNVFQMVVGENQEFSTSITSNDKNSCEAIFLSVTLTATDLPHIWIRNVSTSSNDGQYIFQSVLNDRTLLSLKTSELLQWNYIGFYTPALSVIPPLLSKNIFNFSPFDQEQKWISVDSDNLQKGIITSPSYCGYMREFTNFELYYSTNFYGQKLINFNIKDIYGTPNITFNNGGQNQMCVSLTACIKTHYLNSF